MLRVLCVVFLVLTCLLASAQAAENLPDLVLKVRPKLCLRYADGDQCELDVEVVWRDHRPANYCLHSSQDKGAIQCWENSIGEQLVEFRRLREDLVYWLVLPGENRRLVEKRVELATLVKDQKRLRTKRRHVWNLI